MELLLSLFIPITLKNLLANMAVLPVSGMNFKTAISRHKLPLKQAIICVCVGEKLEFSK